MNHGHESSIFIKIKNMKKNATTIVIENLIDLQRLF